MKKSDKSTKKEWKAPKIKELDSKMTAGGKVADMMEQAETGMSGNPGFMPATSVNGS